MIEACLGEDDDRGVGKEMTKNTSCSISLLGDKGSVRGEG
jgi:hypothetical protein